MRHIIRICQIFVGLNKRQHMLFKTQTALSINASHSDLANCLEGVKDARENMRTLTLTCNSSLVLRTTFPCRISWSGRTLSCLPPRAVMRFLICLLHNTSPRSLPHADLQGVQELAAFSHLPHCSHLLPTRSPPFPRLCGLFTGMPSRMNLIKTR